MDNDIDDLSRIITYHYKFTLGSGVEKSFDVKLDKESLSLIQTERKSYPEWTELKYFKCPNCPLDEKQHGLCPTAKNLVEIIDFFKGSISYEEIKVLIEMEARRYMKYATIQEGLSSLMGIYMVASGCPIMEKLKPLVRYHLPFATLEETRYRVISMYLLAQYFLYKRGKKPDWELKNLVKIYNDIRIVNENFRKRLSHIDIKDASITALTILDHFANFVPVSIDKNMLGEIESSFSAYFKQEC